MAANLVKKGYAVTVWNRDQSKTAPLAELGASVAPGIAALAQEVEVVVSMLRDDAVVRRLLLEQAIPNAKAGTTFIDMSTVTPGMARQLAEAAAANGCGFLDAPVSGSKAEAAGGQLNIMVGGSAEVLEAQRDILAAMGQNIVHVGPNGASAFLKLANNQLAAVMLAAMGESLALIEKAGIDRTMALEALVGTVSRVAQLKQAKIQAQDWETQFALDLMHKDLTQTLQAADELGLPMPILAVARESYQRARQNGKGALDFAVITES
jgi:3-hydroxyisobutyrate dehydrogenase